MKMLRILGLILLSNEAYSSSIVPFPYMSMDYEKGKANGVIINGVKKGTDIHYTMHFENLKLCPNDNPLVSIHKKNNGLFFVRDLQKNNGTYKFQLLSNESNNFNITFKCNEKSSNGYSIGIPLVK